MEPSACYEVTIAGRREGPAAAKAHNIQIQKTGAKIASSIISFRPLLIWSVRAAFGISRNRDYQAALLASLLPSLP